MTTLLKSAPLLLLLLLPSLLQAQPDRFGLPACSAPSEEFADRTFFLLCHDSHRRVPLWVGYELTPDHLLRTAARPSHFRRDSRLTLPAAEDADYKGSGLTRGHLAPAADFAWSEPAIRATFLLSNALPQYRSPNCGRWAQLEAAVREIARAADAVYIFAGPIFSSTQPKTIGPHHVAVPSYTFKVVLVLHAGRKTMYAAIVPNTPEVTEPLAAFTTSVDQVQRETGLDFFNALGDDEENLLESQVNSFGHLASGREVQRGGVSDNNGHLKNVIAVSASSITCCIVSGSMTPWALSNPSISYRDRMPSICRAWQTVSLPARTPSTANASAATRAMPPGADANSRATSSGTSK